MKTGQELYNDHLNRLKKAIAMEKTDRPPIMMHAGAFFLRYAGGKLSDFIKRMEYGNELALKGLLSLGDIDSVLATGEYPPLAGIAFLSRTKVPGRELPDDILWQVDERGMLTEDDYDTIIDKGWNYVFEDICKNRLGDPMKEMEGFFRYVPEISRKYKDSGIVPLTEGALTVAPFDIFCGGRSFAKFLKDLHRMPNKIEAALDAAMVDQLNNLRQQLRTFKPLTVFLGAGRGAGDFLKVKDFERFVWPHMKKLAETIVEENATVYLHLDLCWDRYLDYFLELPKGKCIFHPDSTTDIFKAGDVLKGHMCFMGDVSPALLTLGTPDETYKYSRRLVDEFSPQGFIMAVGCCMPPNAKPENVKAMLAAALEG